MTQLEMENLISTINDLFFIFNSFILCLIIHYSMWIYRLCLHGGFGKLKSTSGATQNEN